MFFLNFELDANIKKKKKIKICKIQLKKKSNTFPTGKSNTTIKKKKKTSFLKYTNTDFFFSIHFTEFQYFFSNLNITTKTGIKY